MTEPDGPSRCVIRIEIKIQKIAKSSNAIMATCFGFLLRRYVLICFIQTSRGISSCCHKKDDEVGDDGGEGDDSFCRCLRENQDVPVAFGNADVSISTMLLLLLLLHWCSESIGSTTLGPSSSLRHGSLLLAVRRVIAIVIVELL